QLLRHGKACRSAFSDRKSWKILGREGLEVEPALARFHLETLVGERQRDLGPLRKGTQNVEELACADGRGLGLAGSFDGHPGRDLDLDVGSDEFDARVGP